MSVFEIAPASFKATKLETPRRTVAIVDDDSSMRKSMERLLNAFGYRAVAFDSAEIRPSDRAETLGCLVLDIHLGKMSGIGCVAD